MLNDSAYSCVELQQGLCALGKKLVCGLQARQKCPIRSEPQQSIFGHQIEGVPVKGMIGKSGNMTIEAEYK